MPQKRNPKLCQDIIAAAAEEFVHSGYHGTAMTAIATRAGYAVQTVYFVFHTKAELFAAVIAHAEVGAKTVVFLLDGPGRVRFVETQRLVGQIHEVTEDREVPGHRVTRREVELRVRVVINIGRAG